MASTPLTLSNPGLRTDRMNADRAVALVEQWTAQLASVDGGHVETLDLQGRVYDVESLPILVDFLQDKLSNCTVVWMNDIIASLPTEQGLILLGGFAALVGTAPIVELNVSDNAIGQQGLALPAFQTLLQCPTLERLTMENDGLDEYCMEQLKDIITQEDASGHCVCDQLTLLHLYNNMSGIKGAKFAGEIVARCRKLESFRYEGCRPQPEGCQFIANGLLDFSCVSDSLQRLRLEGSYNKDVDLDPIGALLKAIRNSPNLKHIMLYDAALEHLGTKLVCRALMRHKLESLQLPQNEVTKTTVSRAIVALVQNNITTLKILNLSENELKNVGVERLMEVFKGGKAVLEVLKLEENEIGTRGAMALIANVEMFPNLKKLYLDSNFFSDEVVEQLQEAFGDKLMEMENNGDEDDGEEDDDDEDDEEEEDDDEEEDDNNDDEDVDELTHQFEDSQLS
jgi:Ran GTPase-activating protein 1